MQVTLSSGTSYSTRVITIVSQIGDLWLRVACAGGAAAEFLRADLQIN